MKSAFIAAASSLLAGCAAVPPPPLASDPSNPAIATAPVSYQPVTVNYIQRRPVEPADWRELNRRVGPQGGGQ